MESPLCPPADPGFRLIETFGYAPGQGCARLRRHLGRMQGSARDLGMAFDMAQARALTDAIGGEGPLRCRLTLGVDGAFDLTTAPMAPVRGPWRIGISDVPLNSGDPWLRHKTTRRAIYDQARANLHEGVDELVFLNERGELCEGTITNVFVRLMGGRRVTPPLSSGLLPGVLRQAMLDRGEVAEAVVTVDDLRRARWITVGNSLRGEILAELVWPPHSAAFRAAGLSPE